MKLNKIKRKIKNMKKIDDIGCLSLLFSLIMFSSIFFVMEKKKIVLKNDKHEKIMEIHSSKAIDSKAPSTSTPASSTLKCVSDSKTWNKVHQIYSVWQANQWHNWINWANWCDWCDWGNG